MLMNAQDSDIELNDDSDFEFPSSDTESESLATDGSVIDSDVADTSVMGPIAKIMNTNGTCCKRSSNADPAEEFTWTSAVNVPTADFTETYGFRNLPANLTNNSESVDFLELFLDSDIIQLMVDRTNKRAAQTKEMKPNDYYASSWTDITVSEMRAFLVVRLSMEHLVIKPRYADYFSTSCKLTHTPGYRTVFSKDRFLSIWKFFHVVNEEDPGINKSDKIYKVCPAISHILEKFQSYYYPGRMLSLDEGMVPFKGHLFIKQYCKDKPTKWGIKVFLLTDSINGYLYTAEVYTGKVDECFRDELGATGNVVVRLLRGIEHKNHVVFTDRFLYVTAVVQSLVSEWHSGLWYDTDQPQIFSQTVDINQEAT